MQSSWLFLLAWLLGLTPAQSREASLMVLEHHDDVCTALSPAECCAQMLEIALFRATGEQVPKGAKAPVRLSCADPDKTMPENACRLIAMGRGFAARDAAEMCTPGGLARRCADDASCKQCVTDLDHLDWKSPQRACYPLTYVTKRGEQGTRIVRLEAGKSGDAARVRRMAMH
jgi:hypothetical protein